MNYNLFHNTSSLGDAYSFLASFKLKSPEDTTKAKFIKYFNDKTVVFNNQIISGLLLRRTHGCKHCQARRFTFYQNQSVNLFLISNCMQL